MHELHVTESILQTVLRSAAQSQAQRILRIHLIVGELTDFKQEWIQRYFDYLSKASIAEGARISIERVPASFRCNGCGQELEAGITASDSLRCPFCSGVGFSLVHGREFLVKDMEVE